MKEKLELDQLEWVAYKNRIMDDVFEFLNTVRTTGQSSMLESPYLLTEKFDLTLEQADQLLTEWTKRFEQQEFRCSF